MHSRPCTKLITPHPPFVMQHVMLCHTFPARQLMLHTKCNFMASVKSSSSSLHSCLQILPEDSVQSDVYQAAVQPVVEDVLNGYNGTIMAYGQTGAGKTYTLSSIQPEAIGMIPRAAAEIFAHISTDVLNEYTVFMSYIQIYMEIIQVGPNCFLQLDISSAQSAICKHRVICKVPVTCTTCCSLPFWLAMSCQD